MKTKLFLYIGLAVVGLVLAVNPATAENLQWSTVQKFDDGQDTAVAMHPSGLILEFHRNHVYGGIALWYHVGKMNGTGVTWGGSQGLPDEGTWPNVAITRDGYVLYVWSTGFTKSDSELYYMVGKIDPNGDVNQSITWLTEKKHWDAGFHSSIAMNDNGVIVGVHESGSGGVGLYYRVGHFADPARGNFNIVWDSGEWGINYDDGINPHIALNNRNEVVEVHQVKGERLVHYRRGLVLSGGIIDFRPSQRYDDNAYQPAVALLDSGLVIELHTTGSARTGTLSLSNPNLINWSNSVKIGGFEYPAVATNGAYVLATGTEIDLLTGKLFYSFAKIP